MHWDHWNFCSRIAHYSVFVVNRRVLHPEFRTVVSPIDIQPVDWSFPFRFSKKERNDDQNKNCFHWNHVEHDPSIVYFFSPNAYQSVNRCCYRFGWFHRNGICCTYRKEIGANESTHNYLFMNSSSFPLWEHFFTMHCTALLKLQALMYLQK